MISQLYSSYSRHSFIYKISITMYIWYIPSTLGYSESQYCELPFHERRLVSLCVPRNARVSLIDEVYDEYEPGVASMSRQQKAEAAKERFVHWITGWFACGSSWKSWNLWNVLTVQIGPWNTHRGANLSLKQDIMRMRENASANLERLLATKMHPGCLTHLDRCMAPCLPNNMHVSIHISNNIDMDT